MSMKITQEYMDSEVINPIMEKFDEVMRRCDELEKLIKRVEKDSKQKISWMSDNIAKIPKKKK